MIRDLVPFLHSLSAAWTAVAAWIQAHRALALGMAGFSVFVFLATLIAVPILVTRMPSDYFAVRSRKAHSRTPVHPVRRVTLLLVKNGIGILLFAAGIAMLVLPGQGLLTLLVGIMIMDFPGKFRLERWIVSLPVVHRSIDWIRARNGRAPLDLG